MKRGRPAASPSCRRRVAMHCVRASSVTGIPRHTSWWKRSLVTRRSASRTISTSASRYRALSSIGTPSRLNRRLAISSSKRSKQRIPVVMPPGSVIAARETYNTGARRDASTGQAGDGHLHELRLGARRGRAYRQGIVARRQRRERHAGCSECVRRDAMARAQPARPVADERRLELDRDRRVLTAVDHADSKLPFAEIEHEAGAHGHTKDALDRRTRFRQVAHDRLVTVVVVDHADTTEYRAALGPMDLGPARLDLHFAAGHALG